LGLENNSAFGAFGFQHNPTISYLRLVQRLFFRYRIPEYSNSINLHLDDSPGFGHSVADVPAVPIS
jgi:hypothetical protein